MRKWTSFFLLFALLSNADLLFAQNKHDHQDNAITANSTLISLLAPMTRLAYSDTRLYLGTHAGYSKVCLAISEDRNFRLWRGFAVRDDVVGGTLTEDEMKQLQEMLAQAKLSPRNGLVHGFTTSFMVEEPLKDGDVERRSWVADRETPFPESVSRLENWLQDFKPQQARKLNLGKHDVCPAPREWPVKPNSYTTHRDT